MKKVHFDKIISSPIICNKVQVKNLAELIFEPIKHRDENSEIILSHDDSQYVRISLKKYRQILLKLYRLFEQKDFHSGDTVLLASIQGNNELFVCLLFSALASFGIRVFLPMFMESTELDKWLKISDCKAVICPSTEILSLNHHHKEKAIIQDITRSAQKKGLPLYDNLIDFHLRELIRQPELENCGNGSRIYQDVLKSTKEETEALIITTSGSSGKSNLVVHEQGSFLKSCQSWQDAGFFEQDRFGGRGFTPLFSHTMGIRAFFNALWCGHSVCLINTEWFSEKPETVRYFLIQMKPEHITGGTATFQSLLEMMRQFPELKTELMPHMKTIISSGAAFNPNLVSEIESVFDVYVHNAFGTTETQQVLNSLLNPSSDPEDRLSMGAPLPGVTLGLEHFRGKSLYRLYVKSPFSCKEVLGETHENRFRDGHFYTGDIVRLENNKLFYVGRESIDFIKDGFGVKIPLVTVKEYYAHIVQTYEHMEIYPLLNEPGLGALIFTADKKNAKGPVIEEKERNKAAQIIERINNHLYQKLDPFVYRHQIIRRFVLVNDSVLKTAKGSIAITQIQTRYSDLITNLVSVFPHRQNVKILKNREYCSSPYTTYLNPYVGGMLDKVKMDVVYHRSQKDSLYAYKNQKEVEILDMVGGYGANLLGHNNPALVETVKEFMQDQKTCISNQGSIQYWAGLLAEKLNLLVGRLTGKNYRVYLGSTGAEIVEMSLHHACLEWRERLFKSRDKQFQLYGGLAGELVRKAWRHNKKIIDGCRLHVVVSKDGFHGHSSGARSLLKNSEKRDRFKNILPLNPIYVDDQNPDWQQSLEETSLKTSIALQYVVAVKGKLRIETRKVSSIAAAMFEPVLGEGGIRSLKIEFLKYFSLQNYPLILDEIQCGLGRTGSFPASLGVDAQYYLFSKALGGGIEKIGALLIESSRSIQEFDKSYSSTFAYGELAAQVALKVIDIIEQDGIPQKASICGKKIRDRLDDIRSKYPDVIADITGEGLIQGIRFFDFRTSDSLIMRILAENKMSGYIYSSYLLNNHNIRILPSSSASNVLRVEPSAYILDKEIEKFCDSIEDLSKIIHEQGWYQLLKHLMDDDIFSDNKGKQCANGFLYSGLDSPSKGAAQVAFIGHFVYPADELRLFGKELCRASDTGLRILFNRTQHLLEMKPVTIFKKNILKERIHFHYLVIPLDSAELERRHREGQRNRILNKIQKAVDMAISEGSQIISLGGYASILSDNGMAIAAPDNVKVITGNTLTAASGLRRLINEIRSNRNFRKRNVLGIVGAHGNIGTILCEQLIPMNDLFQEVILIGRKQSQLDGLVRYLNNKIDIPPDVIIDTQTDMRCLVRCDVIIISTNANDPIIFSHHIRQDGMVLIVDNSVPAAVSEDVLALPNVKNLPFASYIQLPDDPDFVVSSYTPKGTVFSCAAEPMLCGLEKVKIPLRGMISNEAVSLLTELAAKHGFFNHMSGLTINKQKEYYEVSV